MLISQFNHTNLDIRSLPNDSLFYKQWALLNDGTNGGAGTADIDAESAWDITTGGLTPFGDTIVVAVIDMGFDLDHEDLVENMFFNYNEIDGNGMDDDGNGYVDDVQGWDFYNNDPVQPTKQSWDACCRNDWRSWRQQYRCHGCELECENFTDYWVFHVGVDGGSVLCLRAQHAQIIQ